MWLRLEGAIEAVQVLGVGVVTRVSGHQLNTPPQLWAEVSDPVWGWTQTMTGFSGILGHRVSTVMDIYDLVKCKSSSGKSWKSSSSTTVVEEHWWSQKAMRMQDAFGCSSIRLELITGTHIIASVSTVFASHSCLVLWKEYTVFQTKPRKEWYQLLAPDL